MLYLLKPLDGALSVTQPAQEGGGGLLPDAQPLFESRLSVAQPAERLSALRDGTCAFQFFFGQIKLPAYG